MGCVVSIDPAKSTSKILKAQIAPWNVIDFNMAEQNGSNISEKTPVQSLIFGLRTQSMKLLSFMKIPVWLNQMQWRPSLRTPYPPLPTKMHTKTCDKKANDTFKYYSP